MHFTLDLSGQARRAGRAVSNDRGEGGAGGKAKGGVRILLSELEPDHALVAEFLEQAFVREGCLAYGFNGLRSHEPEAAYGSERDADEPPPAFREREDDGGDRPENHCHQSNLSGRRQGDAAADRDKGEALVDDHFEGALAQQPLRFLELHRVRVDCRVVTFGHVRPPRSSRSIRNAIRLDEKSEKM